MAVADATRNRWLVFAVIATGTFMAQLDLFIVNIAFPAIQHDFAGTTAASLSWVLNAYAIVFAACLVPAGRLGDLVGRRRTFELGLVVFAAGSAGCAAAPGVAVLVAARAVQAVGAALIVPTSLGLLMHAFPPDERTGAVGAWASVGAIAAASGPPLGGALVEASWRWIFIVNLPMALGALIASRRYVEEVRHPDAGGRPDLLGIVLLIGGIGTLVLCIVRGGEWGWGVAAVVLLAAFIQRCRTHPNPIVELPLLRLRPFAVANVVMLCFYVGFGAMLLGSVLFLTGPWHQTTIVAGLMIAPGPLVVALLSVHVKRLIPRFGFRAVVVTGCLCFTAGTAWWRWRLGPEVDYVADYLPGMLLGGIGVALSQASLFGLAAAVLPGNRFSTGSGILNMSRQIALALGVAILVALSGFDQIFDEMIVAGLAAAAAATLLDSRA